MNKFLVISLLFIGQWVPQFATAQIEFHSDRIKTMSVEELQQIVTRNMRKLEDDDEGVKLVVKQSLELVLAQPDQSRVSSDIFSQLRNLSRGEKNFLDALEEIIDEGLTSLKKTGKNKDLLREQNTYLYILNNMLAELKGSKDVEEYKRLILKIRDAEIDISDSLISYRLLNSMAQAENPSTYANTIFEKKKPWWKFW
ncbi:MAG: hypothetical protein K2Q26_07605 [Bdellovibrionales bacterium]|nr:hypothetical protein [Bdellovibrionales bacterium]